MKLKTSTDVPTDADIPTSVLGLQEELHQLRLGQSKDRQDIADSLARTQAIERKLYTEREVKKLIDDALQKFTEDTLANLVKKNDLESEVSALGFAKSANFATEDAFTNYVKKEDLELEVLAAGFAKSADLATKDDIARFNPLIDWMRIFSDRTLESMTGLARQIADNRESIHSLERLAVSTLTHQAIQANLADLVSGLFSGSRKRC